MLKGGERIVFDFDLATILASSIVGVVIVIVFCCTRFFANDYSNLNRSSVSKTHHVCDIGPYIRGSRKTSRTRGKFRRIIIIVIILKRQYEFQTLESCNDSDGSFYDGNVIAKRRRKNRQSETRLHPCITLALLSVSSQSFARGNFATTATFHYGKQTLR